MKKKVLCIVVIVLIVANVFLSTTMIPNNQSKLSLVLLEARADEPPETDPPEPGGGFPPTRSFPSDWTLNAIIDYFF